jgi:hypothetical protein
MALIFRGAFATLCLLVRLLRMLFCLAAPFAFCMVDAFNILGAHSHGAAYCEQHVQQCAAAAVQVAHLKRELTVSQQHVARIRGVTDTSGLDVFAANAKVKEQAATIATLRKEVRIYC